MTGTAEELIVTIGANAAMNRLAAKQGHRNQSQRDQSADARS
jgi:hypothetical protein